MSRWQLQDVLGLVGLAFVYLLGLREFAKITSNIRRWLAYLTATALFAGAVVVFSLWPAPMKMFEPERVTTPVATSVLTPTPTFTPGTIPTPTSTPTGASTLTPTPTAKPKSVLLPTPTTITIRKRERSTERGEQEYWDPRQYGYVNEAGDWQMTVQWDRAYSFSEGLALVRALHAEGELPEPYHYIDTNGSFVVSAPSSLHGGDFVEGLAPAKDMKKHKWGYIDVNGSFIIPGSFYMTAEFSEGLGMVMTSENRHGFVNRSGEMIVPARWSNALGFSEGLAAVAHGGLWGYIDKFSNMVIPLRWADASSFREGVATVKQGTQCSLIDKKGMILKKTDFDYIGPFSNGYALARRNGVYGFIDKAGKEVSPFVWEKILRDDPQGESRQIYWNLARRAGAGSATIVWVDPDLKEIWRGKAALLAEPE